MLEIDTSGRSCPLPVLMARKAIEENPLGEIAVLGDTEISKENVSRFARSRGYVVTEERREGGYRLLLRKPG